MTTPNGQHQIDPNGSSQQATSTVLALDGWGPVIAEPASNGANGSEPEPIVEQTPALEVETPRSDWRESIRSGWRREVPRPTIDGELIRVIAPIATMAIAVIAALKLGDAYRTYLLDRGPLTAQPAPLPPSRIATLRRSVALAIDPSLTPVESPRPIWQRWLG